MKQYFKTCIIAFSTIATSAYCGDHLFTGADFERASGIVNLRLRPYDPDTGAFLTKDPLGIQSNLNMYGYVNSNPVNLIDPTGLFSFGIGIGVNAS